MHLSRTESVIDRAYRYPKIVQQAKPHRAAANRTQTQTNEVLEMPSKAKLTEGKWDILFALERPDDDGAFSW